MFASVVEFRLNPIFKEEFVVHWQDYVSFLKKHEALIEATLHHETPISLIAYYKWSSRDSFEEYSLHPRGEALSISQVLQGYCNDVKLLHRMDIISLKHQEQ